MTVLSKQSKERWVIGWDGSSLLAQITFLGLRALLLSLAYQQTHCFDAGAAESIVA